MHKNGILAFFLSIFNLAVAKFDTSGIKLTGMLLVSSFSAAYSTLLIMFLFVSGKNACSSMICFHNSGSSGLMVSHYTYSHYILTTLGKYVPPTLVLHNDVKMVSAELSEIYVNVYETFILTHVDQ